MKEEVVSLILVDVEAKQRRFGEKKRLPFTNVEPELKEQVQEWSSQGGLQEGSQFGSELAKVSGGATTVWKMRKGSASDQKLGGVIEKCHPIGKLAGKQKKAKILMYKRISMVRTT